MYKYYDYSTVEHDYSTVYIFIKDLQYILFYHKFTVYRRFL